MEEQVINACKNCGYALELKFCPNCGQVADTPRITRAVMWREFLRVYMNIDKGLIFTVKQMLTRPGLAPRDYIDGKRVSFMKPLTFIAIGSAICTAAVRQEPADASAYYHIHEIPQTLLKMIFVGTVLSRIFLKDQRFNFWEALILHVFVNFVFLALASVMVFFFGDNALSKVIFVLPPLFAVFQTIAYWQFYDLKSPMAMLKGAAVAGLLTILGIRMLL